MPKVPLTDKEKQMRAEALRRFNTGGSYQYDPTTGQFTGNLNFLGSNINFDEINKLTSTMTGGAGNDTLPGGAGDPPPADDPPLTAAQIAAKEAGFTDTEGNINTEEYLTTLENDAIFNTVESTGSNLTGEQTEAIRSAVQTANESGTTVSQEELDTIANENAPEQEEEYDPTKIDPTKTTDGALSADFRTIEVIYYNSRGEEVSRGTRPNPLFSQRDPARTTRLKRSDGTTLVTYFNQYGIQIGQEVLQPGEEESEDPATTPEGGEQGIVDFTAGQVADPTMPAQAIYDYTPQQIDEVRELLDKNGFDLDVLMGIQADTAEAGTAVAPTSPGAKQGTAELVGSPGTAVGADGTVSTIVTPQEATPTEDAKVRSVTGTPGEQIITPDEMPSRTVTDTENPVAATTDFDAKTYVGDTPQSTFVSNINDQRSVGTVGDNEIPTAATADGLQREVTAAEKYVLSGDATFLAKSLNVDDTVVAQFIQGNVQARDTVQGQLSLLMDQFNDGTPAWAAGAIRAANDTMAARGMGASSLAAAAIVQASMESALPIAQADAQVYSNMNLTNLNNQQKIALEVAAAQRGTQLQNLSNEQQAELAKSTSAFQLGATSLSNLQAAQVANAQLRAALQGQNLTNTQQTNIIEAGRFAEMNNLNLSNEMQARLQDTANNLQVDMSNMSTKAQVVLSELQTQAALAGQELTNAQQSSVVKSERFFSANNLTFNAEQARVLSNSKMIETIELENLDFEQARTVQNAATFAQMEMAGLNNRQQAQVTNAQNFLQMDLQNLSNDQQAAIISYQTKFQGLLSDQAAQNTMEQFNVTSENDIAKFYDNLAADISKYQAQLDTTISQFNAGQVNTIEQFNNTMQNNRDQFNAKNQIEIAQSNANWYRQINTVNTSGENAEAQINAANYLGLSNAALANMWQEYRDTADQAWSSSESAKDRAFQLAAAALQAEMDQSFYDQKLGFAKDKSMTELLFGFLGAAYGR